MPIAEAAVSAAVGSNRRGSRITCRGKVQRCCLAAARPAWLVVLPPARRLWVPGGWAGGCWSWKMGCSSSKLCLYSQCAAARVISICFAALFWWQGAGQELGCEQGESAPAAGSLDLVTSAVQPWVRSACRQAMERLGRGRGRACASPRGAGLGAEGPGRLPSPDWGAAPTRSGGWMLLLVLSTNLLRFSCYKKHHLS